MNSRQAQDAPWSVFSKPDIRNEAGFSLMEAIVATIISVIAVLGLAHSFGMGRGFIERFAVGRTALGIARGKMETLTLPANADSIALGRSYVQPFNYQGSEAGTIEWRVVPYDEPQILGPVDLHKLVLVAHWGPPNERDSLRINRLLQP